jgi:hypothetical protein
MWPTALRPDGSVHDPNTLHMSMIERIAQRAKEFDALGTPAYARAVILPFL